jgi:hypothetical protein
VPRRGVPERRSACGVHVQIDEEAAMTGQAHLLAFLPVVIGVVAIAFLVWRDARQSRNYRLELRRFLCPILRRKVNATIVRDEAQGSVIGVQSCDAFEDPESVTCDRACVATFGPPKAPPAVAGTTTMAR